MWNVEWKRKGHMCYVQGSRVDNRALTGHGPVCTNKEGGKPQYAYIVYTCTSALHPL